jgi:hypothetical protein
MSVNHKGLWYDPADDPAIIDARLAAGIGWKMWRNLRKLRIRQPKMVENHRLSFRKP